ncbi:MAG: hypothetical protein KO202_07695 [Methanobacteriaceae archaeon]|nr:hypothetical protein [Methanobacteriaceae archaeon]
MVKKNVTISIDEEVWQLASKKLDNGRSGFIEDQLKRVIGLEDDHERELLKLISEKQDELNVLESKLCKVREKRLKKSKENNILDDAMVSINRIQERLGVVGVNQIKMIAKQNDVSFDVLYDNCVSSEMDLVNFMEAPGR